MCASNMLSMFKYHNFQIYVYTLQYNSKNVKNLNIFDWNHHWECILELIKH